MLIIVEGVDGVGKTTFVEELERKLLATRELFSAEDEVHVLHRGPPESSEALEEYELPLQWYRPRSGSHVICDRWHVGELVYGPLLRGRSILDPARQLHLELFLQSRGALLVHLIAPDDEVVRRREKRGEDDLITDEQVAEVSRAYHEAFWNSTDPGCNVNTFGDVDRSGQVLVTLALASARSLASHPLTDYPTYVGPTKPEFLLLGDRRNQNSDNRWEGAFVPVTGSSGHFLLSHLPEPLRSSCGIANACETEDLRGLWERLDRPDIVALGQNSHHQCICLGLDHGAVPHPQYVRRFHHHDGAEYGHLVHRAALFGENLLSWRP